MRALLSLTAAAALALGATVALGGGTALADETCTGGNHSLNIGLLDCLDLLDFSSHDVYGNTFTLNHVDP